MLNDHPYYPNVLITCDDLASEIDRNTYVVIEVDLDPDSYDQGHIPGALRWDWKSQLRNNVTSEALDKEAFEALMQSTGISIDTPVVFYGDNNNWFACWAFWLMKLYGHENVWILDGGPRKWFADGHPVSDQATSPRPPSEYRACSPDMSLKATTQDIFESFFNPKTHRLLDVRSAAEYRGNLAGPGPGLEPTCQIAGHIPTAINIPWNLNCNADGTFKSPEELRSLYRSFDIVPELSVITYCAIGERASLSWFVLKHLLEYTVVMNYESSMSRWSCIPNAPIVQGDAA